MDEGYFPRGRSVLRRVHGERLVGLHYGQRALCIGALKPLNYVGTAEHTRQKLTPFRRLAHTGKMFETIFFGTREEADRVLAMVHRMHERVNGALPEDAGPHYPRGTRYDAFDPQLMLWTVAVAADSAEHFYDLFVRRLEPAERESFWQDYIRFAELFGMPRDVAPPTYPDFRAWWDEQLSGEDLHLTPEAKVVGAFTAFEIPMPTHLQPAKRVHDLIMLGSLPARVRVLYGLSWSPRQEMAHRAVVRAMRAARPVTPKPLARGYCTRYFDLVASTERRRIERGRPTPQVAA
ncbi:MAG: oxygenase MpaB family protein [Thermoleophilaceae bacterium]